VWLFLSFLFNLIVCLLMRCKSFFVMFFLPQMHFK
jgi:hypothetical protein